MRIVTLAVVALVAPILTTGAAAASNTPEPDPQSVTIASIDECEALAGQEASTAGYEIYDFSCMPNGVTVSDVTPRQLSASETQTPVAAERARVAADPICNILTNYREIINELQSNFSFCVYWGRKTASGQVLWLDSLSVTGTMYPQYQFHSLNYIGNADAHAPFSMTYDIQTWKHQLGTFPYEVAFKQKTHIDVLNNFQTVNEWIDADTPIWQGGPGANGVYNLSYGNLHIAVPTENFSQNVDGSFDSHRFLCQREESKCLWPDGEEAGLF